GRQAENREQGPGNKKSGTAPTEVSQGGEDPRDNDAPPSPYPPPRGEGRVRGTTPAWSEWPRVLRTIHYHRILDKVLARAGACQAPTEEVLEYLLAATKVSGRVGGRGRRTTGKSPWSTGVPRAIQLSSIGHN